MTVWVGWSYSPLKDQPGRWGVRISDDAVIVGLGSSLSGDYGSSEEQLEAAIAALTASGFEIIARSSWWESISWPDPTNPPYLNGVVVCAPMASAEQAMAALHAIEDRFGRNRAERNGPRTLDLDLVAFGRRIGKDPETPHPRAHERRFVMGPLAELDPDWRHPQSGLTALVLARGAEIGQDAHPIPMKAAR